MDSLIFRLNVLFSRSLTRDTRRTTLCRRQVSLLVALGVVIGTTAVIGDMSEFEARASLEKQIKRHLTDASVEAAATIGERFRKIQYGVLDVTAFALRDALQEVGAAGLEQCRWPRLPLALCASNQSLALHRRRGSSAPPFCATPGWVVHLAM